jgi:hypothetical protein
MDTWWGGQHRRDVIVLVGGGTTGEGGGLAKFSSKCGGGAGCRARRGEEGSIQSLEREFSLVVAIKLQERSVRVMVRYDEADSSWQELAVELRSEGEAQGNRKITTSGKLVVNPVLMYTRSSYLQKHNTAVTWRACLWSYGCSDCTKGERFSSQARRVSPFRYFFRQLQSRCMVPAPSHEQ